ncbi:hypothetical protein DNL40_04010 [Xylanimonas oleitrophica]|uniref:Uncharacterized protein n=1 Tax=Xylanimonas oleitrophica TaxID=2607479 RepID=A0A2W5WTC2_9MICO|nr:hypothetical protein [Xylanimonas oleitrophica]PZR54112.1 hypothetical protein DNL40_04010 [Xylanimonas oleitrophica]
MTAVVGAEVAAPPIDTAEHRAPAPVPDDAQDFRRVVASAAVADRVGRVSERLFGPEEPVSARVQAWRGRVAARAALLEMLPAAGARATGAQSAAVLDLLREREAVWAALTPARPRRPRPQPW